MKVETGARYEEVERNGAVKVHALAAPHFGDGSDGLFMSVSPPVAFLLSTLPGKLSHEGGDVGSPPCAGARPQLYRLGETSVLAALPPCAFTHGDEFKNLRQAQERVFRQLFHVVSPCCIVKGNIVALFKFGLLPCFCSQAVQIVGPFLKHTAAFRQVFSPVVNPAYLLRRGMGKLAFNPVPVVAEFIQQG